jgi:hypothetical protein
VLAKVVADDVIIQGWCHLGSKKYAKWLTTGITDCMNILNHPGSDDIRMTR